MTFAWAFLYALGTIILAVAAAGLVLGLGQLAYLATRSTAVGLGVCVVVLALLWAVVVVLLERS
jgi:hypothetical protein